MRLESHPSGWVSRRKIKGLQDIVNRHKAKHLLLKGETERDRKRDRDRERQRDREETHMHTPRE